MIKLGIITGTQGVDGKMYIKTLDDIKVDTKKIKSLEIGFSEKYAKIYQINALEKYRNGYTLKIDAINSKEQAENFKEQAVFMSEEFIQNKKNNINTSEIIGYIAYNDVTFEEIGVVSDILTMPSNDLLVVESSSREVLVPFIDEFISSIEKDSGKLFITVVPGLIEIND